MYENQNPFYTARRFFFGAGIRKIVGEKLKESGVKRVLLIYDKGVESVGIPDKIIAPIKAAGIETVSYNGVLADPPSSVVNEAAKFGKDAKVDAIIGLGGGSSIDTSKATRVLLSSKGPLDVNRYIFDSAPQTKPVMPIMIIPTTAGTGSEATEGAMISHIDENGVHWKKLLECLSNPEIDSAVVDPELALGTPKHISMNCAFDVLAHASETTMTILTSPIMQAIAESAIRLFVQNCRKVYDDINDLDARIGMALSCNLTGFAMQRSYVNAGHAFGHALGSVFNVPHGLACGVFGPAVIEYYANAAPEQIARIGAIFGVVREPSENNEIYTARFARTLHKFASDVGVDLKNIVADREECYKIIPQVLEDYSWRLGLREMDEAGAKWVIDRTYAY